MHAVLVALAVLCGLFGLSLANFLASSLFSRSDDPAHQTRDPSDREV